MQNQPHRAGRAPNFLWWLSARTKSPSHPGEASGATLARDRLSTKAPLAQLERSTQSHRLSSQARSATASPASGRSRQPSGPGSPFSISQATAPDAELHSLTQAERPAGETQPERGLCGARGGDPGGRRLLWVSVKEIMVAVVSAGKGAPQNTQGGKLSREKRSRGAAQESRHVFRKHAATHTPTSRRLPIG